MFKWLDKVVPGSPQANPVQSAQAAPPPPLASRTKAPTPAHEAERTLLAPTITAEHLDRETLFEDSILVRKVIVDRAYHPVAYEFGLRPDSTRQGEDEATLIVSLLFHLGPERLSASRQTWIRLSDQDLTLPALDALASDRVVLAVRIQARSAAEDEAHLQEARALRKAGFQLALAGWAETPLHRAWLDLCQFVEISLDEHNPVDVGEFPELLNKGPNGDRKIQLVATNVDSYEELEYCHRTRYQLFRGAFLTNRENWPRQPKINPERMRICQFLNQLHSGAELNEIAAQLRYSPELSYRLLRYINSPGVGLIIPVASVQQGLIILGRDKTYRWLTVLLFSSSQGRSIDSALLEQALVRARLMELLAGERFNRTQTEELFTVGIFSQLDLLLKLPMSVALEPLKLPQQVQDALVNDSGDYAPWLRLASLAEGDDAQALRAAIEALGLAMGAVNSAQIEALRWAQEILTE